MKSVCCDGKKGRRSPPETHGDPPGINLENWLMIWNGENFRPRREAEPPYMRERKRSIPGAARDRSGSVAASAWINDADTCINYPLRTSLFQSGGKDHHERRVDQNTPPQIWPIFRAASIEAGNRARPHIPGGITSRSIAPAGKRSTKPMPQSEVEVRHC